MKSLFILLFTISCFFSFSQDKSFKYSFEVDTLIDMSNKSFLSDFTDQINYKSRNAVGKHSFRIISEEEYTQTQFSQIVSLLGTNLVTFDKSMLTIEYQASEKNGGQDCPDAGLVCSNNSFSGNASGFGTQELNGGNSGCLASENQSSWYYVNVDTPGTLEMTISPDDSNDDYDFAVWGPFTSVTAAANCPPSNSPLRCSWSADDGNTGMIASYTYSCWSWGCWCNTTCTQNVTDNSEGSGGDKWVAPLNVNSGEVYILLIDNSSTSTQPFDLTWGGTAGLDCTAVPLPVDLIGFSVSKKENQNELIWTTASETNNDYFIVEYSSNGEIWNEIEKIAGAGNSNIENTYFTTHREFENGINYYRLKQVDFDGTLSTHDIISIDNTQNRSLLKKVNSMGQVVNDQYKGLVIEYYSDGFVEKKYQR